MVFVFGAGVWPLVYAYLKRELLIAWRCGGWWSMRFTPPPSWRCRWRRCWSPWRAVDYGLIHHPYEGLIISPAIC